MNQNAVKQLKNQDYSHDRQRGNVLVWILVFVALFAALSFTVSQGSRTGGQNISREQAELAATEILDYATALRRAVQELQINGCSDTEIDFGNNVYERYDDTKIEPVGDNTNAPSDGSCGVFNPNGGSLNPVIFARTNPSITISSLFKTGHGSSAERDILGIGNDGENDLTFHFADIDNSICLAFNDKLGIENIDSNTPPTETNILILGDESTNLIGQQSFCYFRNATHPRNFIHTVLIAR